MDPESVDEILTPDARVMHLTVLERLGGGSFGTVYKVRDEQLDTLRALKVLRPNLPASHQQRLMSEGRALARLDDHPNVVRVLQVIETDTITGLLLEYVDGPNLEGFMDAHGGPQRQLPLPVVRAVGAGIIRGVMAIHGSQHLHRDLKPDNVLVAVRRDGEIVPKVADFGLVKDLRATVSPDRTRPGFAMGTPLYMAPEQWRDAASVDARADVWSLGVMLYEMVTGVVPFAGEHQMDVLARVLSAPPVAPSSLRPGVPIEMERAILGALQRACERRTPSCAELLEVWLDDAPRTVVRARPTSDSAAPTELAWTDELTTMDMGPARPDPAPSPPPAGFTEVPTVIVVAPEIPELEAAHSGDPADESYDGVNIWFKEDIEALLGAADSLEQPASEPGERWERRLLRWYHAFIEHEHFLPRMGLGIAVMWMIWLALAAMLFLLLR